MSKAGASLATCYGPVSADVIAKAENIRLLILDVDGVLSDGLIYMGNNGEELKAFNVRDGYGIRCALTSDIEVAIITGRKAKLVEDRCATLGITHLYQGQSNKLIAFSDLLEKLAIAPEKARRYRAESKPEKEDTCTMCGKMCAVRNINKILRGENVDIMED